MLVWKVLKSVEETAGSPLSLAMHAGATVTGYLLAAQLTNPDSGLLQFLAAFGAAGWGSAWGAVAVARHRRRKRD